MFSSLSLNTTVRICLEFKVRLNFMNRLQFIYLEKI